MNPHPVLYIIRWSLNHWFYFTHTFFPAFFLKTTVFLRAEWTPFPALIHFQHRENATAHRPRLLPLVGTYFNWACASLLKPLTHTHTHKVKERKEKNPNQHNDINSCEVMINETSVKQKCYFCINDQSTL